MRNRLLVTALLAFSGWSGAALPNPCKLLSAAEVQGLYGRKVDAGQLETGDAMSKCEFGHASGGLMVMVGPRSMLQGKSLKSLVETSDLPGLIHAVPKLGDEAYAGANSALAVEGQPKTLTSAASVFVRKGPYVLMVISLVNGKGPSEAALIKLTQRAVTRLR
ncbi:hypothetical protein [Deinococcus aerophilus]|uniref:DUF3558 domain-containing protein n=1 Tax=Deinococcus aerophilus TaxID=522488 RepID=A0ABQ2GY09_9DEIO|nr:hypothetical protein [Deinococcus aerophilus]GGM17753.1 hypothetical protein GCM10010841_27430 [Deinococcus aerophilus]